MILNICKKTKRNIWLRGRDRDYDEKTYIYDRDFIFDVPAFGL